MNTSVLWQSSYSMVGHPYKFEIQKELQPYWSFRDEIAIIDRIAIKGRTKMIPALLQDKAIKHLHINHMGIEKQEC